MNRKAIANRYRNMRAALAAVIFAYSFAYVLLFANWPAFVFAAFGYASGLGLLAEKRWAHPCAATFGLLLVASTALLKGQVAGAINIFVGFAITLAAALTGPGRQANVSAENLSNAELEGTQMSNGQKTVDQLNYDLEVEKFKWHRATYQGQNSVLNRHFGVIITAIISVAAVSVSYLQLDTSKANLKNEELKNDRQFYLEVAKFLIQHQQDVTSRDPEKVTFLRNVVISAFPQEIALRICTQMSEAGITPDMRRAWAECVAHLQLPPERRRKI